MRKPMRSGSKAATILWLAVWAAALAAGSLFAQVPVVELTEELDFDRPESWAMKYFASAGLLTGFGVPSALAPGAIDLGLEGGWIPSLGEEERRVGFNGTKLEDLNKTPFFGRGRVTIGLPSTLSLTLAYVPPIDVGGVKPNLFAAGLGRPFEVSDRWRIGARGYGQFGTIEGDITCDADTVAAGADPDRNPFSCEEVSSDEYTQRMVGGEVSVGYTSSNQRWRPYAGVAVNYLDLKFQVNARYSGFLDRTEQLTDGVTYALTSGLTCALTPELHLTGEIFYTWLNVVRPPATTTQNDGLLNVRALVSYQIR